LGVGAKSLVSVASAPALDSLKEEDREKDTEVDNLPKLFAVAEIHTCRERKQ
jgi:hypothetical protein